MPVFGARLGRASLRAADATPPLLPGLCVCTLEWREMMQRQNQKEGGRAGVRARVVVVKKRDGEKRRRRGENAAHAVCVVAVDRGEITLSLR